MKSNVECWRRRLVVLLVGASWLTGCATAGFEAVGVAACPPVVEYSRELHLQAAVELVVLPIGPAIRPISQNARQHISLGVLDSEPRNSLNEPEGGHTANAISRQI